MRTTLDLPQALLEEALIGRHSAQRWAALGGTEPQAKRIPRQRSSR